MVVLGLDMDNFYVINDEHAYQFLTHWSEKDDDLWKWDIYNADDISYVFEEFDESARFRTLGAADCVCKKLTAALLEHGTPSDEIDFRVYSVSVEVVKKLHFLKGPSPPKPVSDKAIEKLIRWRYGNIDDSYDEAHSNILRSLEERYSPGQYLEKDELWEHYDALRAFQALSWEERADIVGDQVGYDWRAELERMEDDCCRGW